MAREFSEKLHEMTDAFPGDMQLLFRTLTGEEEEVAIDPDRRVVSASTIKVPVLGCLLDTLGENGTPLEAMHPVTAADILDDTLVFDTGAREASWYEIAWWMIVNSDNTAANVLMKALTFSRINDWCQRRGLRSTRAERMMLDYDAIREGRNNYISPSDYASLVIRADRMAAPLYLRAAGLLPQVRRSRYRRARRGDLRVERTALVSRRLHIRFRWDGDGLREGERMDRPRFAGSI